MCSNLCTHVCLCVRGRAVAVRKYVRCLCGWQAGWEAGVAHGDTEVLHMYVDVCLLHTYAMNVQQPPRMCTWMWVCAHVWVLIP